MYSLFVFQISLCSQEVKDRNREMNESLRAQLSELEVDGDVPNLKEKINNLAAANEKMLKKNENLLEMVELGDEHIKNLEEEKKRMQQRIDVLEKKLQEGRPKMKMTSRCVKMIK